MPNDTKALRKLCDAATPGPWEWRGTDDANWLASLDGDGRANPQHVLKPMAQFIGAGDVWADVSDADAAFIAAARTAMPALLDELDDLRGKMAKLREQAEVEISRMANPYTWRIVLAIIGAEAK